MSEIRANTVSNAAGTGPATLTGQYALKVWCSWNMSGGHSIRDSFNVSSITDVATGCTQVNISSSMSDGNYSVVASAGLLGGSNQYVGRIASLSGPLPSASQVEVTCSLGTSRVDLEKAMVQIAGDLA